MRHLTIVWLLFVIAWGVFTLAVHASLYAVLVSWFFTVPLSTAVAWYWRHR